MSSRAHVRDLVVKSVKAKHKGKISLFVRNDSNNNSFVPYGQCSANAKGDCFEEGVSQQ